MIIASCRNINATAVNAQILRAGIPVIADYYIMETEPSHAIIKGAILAIIAVIRHCIAANDRVAEISRAEISIIANDEVIETEAKQAVIKSAFIKVIAINWKRIAACELVAEIIGAIISVIANNRSEYAAARIIAGITRAGIAIVAQRIIETESINAVIKSAWVTVFGADRLIHAISIRTVFNSAQIVRANNWIINTSGNRITAINRAGISVIAHYIGREHAPAGRIAAIGRAGIEIIAHDRHIVATGDRVAYIVRA